MPDITPRYRMHWSYRFIYFSMRNTKLVLVSFVIVLTWIFILFFFTSHSLLIRFFTKVIPRLLQSKLNHIIIPLLLPFYKAELPLNKILDENYYPRWLNSLISTIDSFLLKIINPFNSMSEAQLIKQMLNIEYAPHLFKTDYNQYETPSFFLNIPSILQTNLLVLEAYADADAHMDFFTAKYDVYAVWFKIWTLRILRSFNVIFLSFLLIIFYIWRQIISNAIVIIYNFLHVILVWNWAAIFSFPFKVVAFILKYFIYKPISYILLFTLIFNLKLIFYIVKVIIKFAKYIIFKVIHFFWEIALRVLRFLNPFITRDTIYADILSVAIFTESLFYNWLALFKIGIDSSVITGEQLKILKMSYSSFYFVICLVAEFLRLILFILFWLPIFCAREIVLSFKSIFTFSFFSGSYNYRPISNIRTPELPAIDLIFVLRGFFSVYFVFKHLLVLLTDVIIFIFGAWIYGGLYLLIYQPLFIIYHLICIPIFILVYFMFACIYFLVKFLFNLICLACTSAFFIFKHIYIFYRNISDCIRWIYRLFRNMFSFFTTKKNSTDPLEHDLVLRIKPFNPSNKLVNIWNFFNLTNKGPKDFGSVLLNFTKNSQLKSGIFAFLTSYLLTSYFNWMLRDSFITLGQRLLLWIVIFSKFSIQLLWLDTFFNIIYKMLKILTNFFQMRIWFVIISTISSCLYNLLTSTLWHKVFCFLLKKFTPFLILTLFFLKDIYLNLVSLKRYSLPMYNSLTVIRYCCLQLLTKILLPLLLFIPKSTWKFLRFVFSSLSFILKAFGYSSKVRLFRVFCTLLQVTFLFVRILLDLLLHILLGLPFKLLVLLLDAFIFSVYLVIYIHVFIPIYFLNLCGSFLIGICRSFTQFCFYSLFTLQVFTFSLTILRNIVRYLYKLPLTMFNIFSMALCNVYGLLLNTTNMLVYALKLIVYLFYTMIFLSVLTPIQLIYYLLQFMYILPLVVVKFLTLLGCTFEGSLYLNKRNFIYVKTKRGVLLDKLTKLLLWGFIKIDKVCSLIRYIIIFFIDIFVTTLNIVKLYLFFYLELAFYPLVLIAILYSIFYGLPLLIFISSLLGIYSLYFLNKYLIFVLGLFIFYPVTSWLLQIFPLCISIFYNIRACYRFFLQVIPNLLITFIRSTLFSIIKAPLFLLVIYIVVILYIALALISSLLSVALCILVTCIACIISLIYYPILLTIYLWLYIPVLLYNIVNLIISIKASAFLIIPFIINLTKLTYRALLYVVNILLKFIKSIPFYMYSCWHVVIIIFTVITFCLNKLLAMKVLHLLHQVVTLIYSLEYYKIISLELKKIMVFIKKHCSFLGETLILKLYSIIVFVSIASRGIYYVIKCYMSTSKILKSFITFIIYPIATTLYFILILFNIAKDCVVILFNIIFEIYNIILTLCYYMLRSFYICVYIMIDTIFLMLWFIIKKTSISLYSFCAFIFYVLQYSIDIILLFFIYSKTELKRLHSVFIDRLDDTIDSIIPSIYLVTAVLYFSLISWLYTSIKLFRYHLVKPFEVNTFKSVSIINNYLVPLLKVGPLWYLYIITVLGYLLMLPFNIKDLVRKFVILVSRQLSILALALIQFVLEIPLIVICLINITQELLAWDTLCHGFSFIRSSLFNLMTKTLNAFVNFCNFFLPLSYIGQQFQILRSSPFIRLLQVSLIHIIIYSHRLHSSYRCYIRGVYNFVIVNIVNSYIVCFNRLIADINKVINTNVYLTNKALSLDISIFVYKYNLYFLFVGNIAYQTIWVNIINLWALICDFYALVVQQSKMIKSTNFFMNENIYYYFLGFDLLLERAWISISNNTRVLSIITKSYRVYKQLSQKLRVLLTQGFFLILGYDTYYLINSYVMLLYRTIPIKKLSYFIVILTRIKNAYLYIYVKQFVECINSTLFLYNKLYVMNSKILAGISRYTCYYYMHWGLTLYALNCVHTLWIDSVSLMSKVMHYYNGVITARDKSLVNTIKYLEVLDNLVFNNKTDTFLYRFNIRKWIITIAAKGFNMLEASLFVIFTFYCRLIIWPLVLLINILKEFVVISNTLAYTIAILVIRFICFILSTSKFIYILVINFVFYLNIFLRVWVYIYIQWSYSKISSLTLYIVIKTSNLILSLYNRNFLLSVSRIVSFLTWIISLRIPIVSKSISFVVTLGHLLHRYSYFVCVYYNYGCCSFLQEIFGREQGLEVYSRICSSYRYIVVDCFYFVKKGCTLVWVYSILPYSLILCFILDLWEGLKTQGSDQFKRYNSLYTYLTWIERFCIDLYTRYRINSSNTHKNDGLIRDAYTIQSSLLAGKSALAFKQYISFTNILILSIKYPCIWLSIFLQILVLGLSYFMPRKKLLLLLATSSLIHSIFIYCNPIIRFFTFYYISLLQSFSNIVCNNIIVSSIVLNSEKKKSLIYIFIKYVIVRILDNFLVLSKTLLVYSNIAFYLFINNVCFLLLSWVISFTYILSLAQSLLLRVYKGYIGLLGNYTFSIAFSNKYFLPLTFLLFQIKKIYLVIILKIKYKYSLLILYLVEILDRKVCSSIFLIYTNWLTHKLTNYRLILSTTNWAPKYSIFTGLYLCLVSKPITLILIAFDYTVLKLVVSNLVSLSLLLVNFSSVAQLLSIHFMPVYNKVTRYVYRVWSGLRILINFLSYSFYTEVITKITKEVSPYIDLVMNQKAKLKDYSDRLFLLKLIFFIRYFVFLTLYHYYKILTAIINLDQINYIKACYSIKQDYTLYNILLYILHYFIVISKHKTLNEFLFLIHTRIYALATVYMLNIKMCCTYIHCLLSKTFIASSKYTHNFSAKYCVYLSTVYERTVFRLENYKKTNILHLKKNVLLVICYEYLVNRINSLDAYVLFLIDSISSTIVTNYVVSSVFVKRILAVMVSTLDLPFFRLKPSKEFPIYFIFIFISTIYSFYYTLICIDLKKQILLIDFYKNLHLEKATFLYHTRHIAPIVFSRLLIDYPKVVTALGYSHLLSLRDTQRYRFTKDWDYHIGFHLIKQAFCFLWEGNVQSMLDFCHYMISQLFQLILRTFSWNSFLYCSYYLLLQYVIFCYRAYIKIPLFIIKKYVFIPTVLRLLGCWDLFNFSFLLRLILIYPFMPVFVVCYVNIILIWCYQYTVFDFTNAYTIYTSPWFKERPRTITIARLLYKRYFQLSLDWLIYCKTYSRYIKQVFFILLVIIVSITLFILYYKLILVDARGLAPVWYQYYFNSPALNYFILCVSFAALYITGNALLWGYIHLVVRWYSRLLILMYCWSAANWARMIAPPLSGDSFLEAIPKGGDISVTFVLHRINEFIEYYQYSWLEDSRIDQCMYDKLNGINMWLDLITVLMWMVGFVFVWGCLHDTLPYREEDTSSHHAQENEDCDQTHDEYFWENHDETSHGATYTRGFGTGIGLFIFTILWFAMNTHVYDHFIDFLIAADFIDSDHILGPAIVDAFTQHWAVCDNIFYDLTTIEEEEELIPQQPQEPPVAPVEDEFLMPNTTSPLLFLHGDDYYGYVFWSNALTRPTPHHPLESLINLNREVFPRLYALTYNARPELDPKKYMYFLNSNKFISEYKQIRKQLISSEEKMLKILTAFWDFNARLNASPSEFQKYQAITEYMDSQYILNAKRSSVGGLPDDNNLPVFFDSSIYNNSLAEISAPEAYRVFWDKHVDVAVCQAKTKFIQSALLGSTEEFIGSTSDSFASAWQLHESKSVVQPYINEPTFWDHVMSWVLWTDVEDFRTVGYDDTYWYQFNQWLIWKDMASTGISSTHNHNNLLDFRYSNWTRSLKQREILIEEGPRSPAWPTKGKDYWSDDEWEDWIWDYEDYHTYEEDGTELWDENTFDLSQQIQGAQDDVAVSHGKSNRFKSAQRQGDAFSDMTNPFEIQAKRYFSKMLPRLNRKYYFTTDTPFFEGFTNLKNTEFAGNIGRTAAAQYIDLYEPNSTPYTLTGLELADPAADTFLWQSVLFDDYSIVSELTIPQTTFIDKGPDVTFGVNAHSNDWFVRKFVSLKYAQLGGATLGDLLSKDINISRFVADYWATQYKGRIFIGRKDFIIEPYMNPFPRAPLYINSDYYWSLYNKVSDIPSLSGKAINYTHVDSKIFNHVVHDYDGDTYTLYNPVLKCMTLGLEYKDDIREYKDYWRWVGDILLRANAEPEINVGIGTQYLPTRDDLRTPTQPYLIRVNPYKTVRGVNFAQAKAYESNTRYYYESFGPLFVNSIAQAYLELVYSLRALAVNFIYVPFATLGGLKTPAHAAELFDLLELLPMHPTLNETFPRFNPLVPLKWLFEIIDYGASYDDWFIGHMTSAKGRINKGEVTMQHENYMDYYREASIALTSFNRDSLIMCAQIVAMLWAHIFSYIYYYLEAYGFDHRVNLFLDRTDKISLSSIIPYKRIWPYSLIPRITNLEYSKHEYFNDEVYFVLNPTEIPRYSEFLVEPYENNSTDNLDKILQHKDDVRNEINTWEKF